MKSQETLGQRLRDLRMRRGISQAQLAFPELSDSYVSLIESDKRTPAPAVVELLAKKLGCSASYLASGVTDETVAELRMTLQYGHMSLQNGEVDEARASFAEVMGHRDLHAFPDLVYDARWGHALALEAAGELEPAVAELERLATTLSPRHDPDRWAFLHIALCRCHREAGDFGAGAEAGERGLHHLTEAHTRWTESMVMLGATLLSIYYERGDLIHAQQFAKRLIDRAEEVGSARARAAAYWNAGIAMGRRGDLNEALRLEERALALLGESDDARNLARLRGDCGLLLLRARPDQAERARDLIQRARSALAAGAASEIDDAKYATNLAKAEITLGRPSEAVKLAKGAIEHLGGDAPRFAVADALIALADGYMSLDLHEEAAEALRKAAETLEGMRSSRQAAQAWFDLAELFGRTGDMKQRADAYRRACACVGLR
ncbi:MAG TPA: helix-turn-helix domain-containing protein [Streptosporangiaceae bacterium]